MHYFLSDQSLANDLNLLKMGYSWHEINLMTIPERYLAITNIKQFECEIADELAYVLALWEKQHGQDEWIENAIYLSGYWLIYMSGGQEISITLKKTNPYMLCTLENKDYTWYDYQSDTHTLLKKLEKDND